MVKSKKSGVKKKDDSKTFAFLATFLSILGFVIALLTKKDDKYVMFYAKQSLALFIAYVIVWIASIIFAIIPIVGGIIVWVLYVGLFILWILSWMNALSGKEKEIPIVGGFTKNLNF